MTALTRSAAAVAVSLALLTTGCEGPPGADAAPEVAPPVAQEGPRRQVIAPEGVSGLRFFSPAIRTGDLIFLSGAIGTVPGTLDVVEGGVGPETTAAMEHQRVVLEAAGATMADVVKCTVFLNDIEQFGAMNEAYSAFFPNDPPARSTVEVSALAIGASVEIECIAVMP